MYLSLALILLIGSLISIIFPKIKIPSLIGYLILGIFLSSTGLVDKNLLMISSVIRKIALVIILLKAGLSLDLKKLKRIGRPAILMCFIPATCEMIAFSIFGPLVLGLDIIESLLIGSVLGAVSPAVVVPRMTNFIDMGIGSKKNIPELIVAGSSADDVYCIVMFTAFSSMLDTKSGFNAMELLRIPTSIVLGILIGLFVGILISIVFEHIHIRDTVKVIILLGLSLLFIVIDEALLDKYVNVSSYLAVISMGMVVMLKRAETSKRLTSRFNKIWVVSEMFLFTLVGASVNLNAIGDNWCRIILMIVICLSFRMIGTFLCLIKTELNMKERLFVLLAELPKATVQAAIGGSLIGVTLVNQDFASLVLSVSVLSILICAPIGAFGIDLSYKKLLE